ncbi:MAG: hypothetical protein JJU02_13180 [Cryomorphaceae bacterium]|nr:hypothetical protein [Cryomorphaceae bacterium]
MIQIFKIFHPWFWFASVLFLINQWLESHGIFIPFVHAYLDDVLAIPIVLGFTLAFQQQFTFQNRNYTFSYGHVIFMILLLSVYFEWYLPGKHDHHYADPWDVLAYSIGGFLFYYFMNKKTTTELLFCRRFPYLFARESV